MDYTSWTFTLILLCSLWRYAKSQQLPSPSNVTVVLQDGEATLVWVPPDWAPLEAYYTVQLVKYKKLLSWTTVPGCELLRSTHCDLTSSINSVDYYWSRVQMVQENMTSNWSKSKRFYKKEGVLLPPTFTLSSSSTSVKVRVHRKPALKAAYGHGLRYTYHLREKGQDNVVNKTVLWTEDGEEEEKYVEFNYLTWGQEYCVHLEVEHQAGPAKSEASSEQCILLPQPVWYTAAIVIAVSLGLLGVLSLLTLLLHCLLWRPKTLPSTLKCPSSAWHPLILGEVPVEKVTDEGWFLFSLKKAGDLGEKQKEMEEGKGEVRRGSMDSGVSVGQAPSEKGEGGDGDGGESHKQEDSGFESLAGTDSNSAGSRQMFEERPLLDGRSSGQDSPQDEDSGLSLRCGVQYNGSGILGGRDCRPLPVEGVVTGDGYRSQKPSFVVVHDFETEKPGKGIFAETDSSSQITVGYRPSQFSCVCLRKGLCHWCQSVTPLTTAEHSMCSYPTPVRSNLETSICIPSSYLGKSNPHNEGDLVHRDMPFVCHIPETESSRSVPLMISVPQPPLVCGGLDSSVNALSLSLQDAELTFG